jgi:GMP synthase (glutamine-hydrolysing)
VSNSPHILLLEANLAANCERATSFGTVPAGERYAMSLRHVCPDVQIDKAYGADLDKALPTGVEIANYDGVVIGGSGLHAYHTDENVTRQIEFSRTVFEAGVPILGSCWGLQISVLAAGGRVAPSPFGREVGIARKVALTREGQGHPLFRGKTAVFDTPCIHLDEVSHVPSGSVLLATNRHSRVQALSFQHCGTDFWGVQYHPEFDLFHLGRLNVMYGDMMVEGGHHQDLDAVAAHSADMEALAADHSRSDLAWKLGVDRDVLDDDIRTLEIRNWVEQKVLARKVART